MILADTTVWIDHFRADSRDLRRLLMERHIVIHPFITAELALGSLRQRANTLGLLDRLPQLRVARLTEVRTMIEARRLFSLGIGLTDAHLIASALIESSTLLWTKDRPLRKVAERFGIHAALI